MELTNIEMFKKLLDINIAFEEAELPMICTIHWSSSSYLFFSLEKTIGTPNDFCSPPSEDSVEAIVEHARTLCEPKFTSLTEMTFNSYTNNVYLDKETEVELLAVTPEGATIKLDGKETAVDILRLFTKEI